MGMKTDLQSCGHCWVLQICWHIECSTFTAPSFRIWNNSAGIPSPPLALFVVMLPKAHWTSHFRMSGSRWVITPPWLSGSWRPFLYSSSVYACHLFLIFSAFVRSIFIPIPKKGNAKECSNYRTIALISHCSKFSKPGFKNTWTVNFQMLKLILEKAEEAEIKLPTPVGSSKKKRVTEKHLFLLYWLCQSFWLCGSQ